MSLTTTDKPSITEPFPVAAVEACLLKGLLQAAEAIVMMNGEVMPAGVPQQSSMSIQLDSLAVVDIVLTVEPVIGFPVKEHVVKAGGYTSVNEAVNDLLPKLEKEWAKQKNKGAKQ